MYSMTSFVGAVAGMIPLMGLIWLNFYWNHRYGGAPWLGWFHIGSAGLVDGAALAALWETVQDQMN